MRTRAGQRGGTSAALWLLVASCVWAAQARAGGPWPQGAEQAGGFFHELWQTESGLPDNTVPALLQTQDGYLWVGTQFGLARFDGVQFTVFNERNTPAMALNYVVALAEDTGAPAGKPSGLWVATYLGLARLRDGEWKKFSKAEGLPSDRMLALVRGPATKDAASTLWVATSAGLARFDGARFQTVPGLDAEVTSVAELASGEVWAGTESGTFRLRGDRLERVTAAQGGVDGPVHALLATSHGALWAGTPEGLVRLSPGPRLLRTTRDGLPGDDIDFLAEDRHGRLWAGGPAGLVLFEHTPQDAPDVVGRWDGHQGLAPVHALIEDREGSIWIGTESGGLHRLRETAFTVFDHAAGLADDFVYGVAAASDGSLWIGTNAGLTRMSDGKPTLFAELEGKPMGAVWTVAIGHDGKVWFSTARGLAVVEEGQVRLVGGKGEAPAGRIRALFEDGEGALWLGTDTGLHRWKDHQVTSWKMSDQVEPGWPLVVRQDRAGRIWVGGPSGLYALDHGRLERVADLRLLRSSQVFSLFPDGDDLWVGAGESGLALVRGGKVLPVPLGDHVYVDGVLQIAEDGVGNLWLASGQGLLRLDKRAVTQVALGERRDFEVRLFDQRDGLRSAEFNGVGQSSTARTADGRLWFASARGLVVFDPRKPPGPSLAPPVAIERLLIDEREVDLRGPLDFPPGRGRVEIHYTANSLRVPDRDRFRYRLEGVDDAFVDAGNRRVALYAGLPGGTFTFHVLATNDEGVWNETGAQVTFTLQPHFTSTWMFYALCTVLAGAAVFGLLRLRALQARRREAALQALVEARTRELAEARDQLEVRVQERTAQLAGELAERARLESQLVQAQKLDSLGRLAGGVAHDLNNVLTAILGYAELLEGSVLDELAKSDVREISAAGGRAAALIRQLLSFARKQRSEPRVVLLDDRIAAVDRMLRRLMPENVSMVLKPGARNGMVRIDPSQLEQVVVNLVVNARDAMPSGGVLTLETTEVLLHEAPPQAATLPHGDYVLFTVTDTGTGMTEDTQRHLFEPFFTTKERGKGTGLGLATCYGIVQQAAGAIAVRSELGRGTTFDVWLPRVRADRKGESAESLDAPSGGRETVLLVEDDLQVRGLASRLLRDAGYTVLEAIDGADALEVAQRWHGPIDLLLTDVVMPRMGGPELATRLLEQRPHVKLVATSGYAEPTLPLGPLEGVPFLRKPFAGPQLLGKVRAALDGAVAEAASFDRPVVH